MSTPDSVNSSEQARKLSRQLAMQALFQQHFNDSCGVDELAAQFLAHESGHAADAEYLHALLHGVLDNLEEIDQLLQPLLDREAERLGALERSLLRIGAWELREQDEQSARTIIAEAVRLAGVFGAADSHKYINAVLDRLASALRSAEKTQTISEFEIIRRYFAPLHREHSWLAAGIGEDCALLEVPPGQQLAVSVDTFCAGLHFPPDAPPADIAGRALRAALSDLAACGAHAIAFSIALTLPHAEQEWLRRFSGGLTAVAREFDVSLIGGDLVRGVLSLSVQVFGLLPSGTALTRRGVCAGDQIYVSGELGGAALALECIQESLDSVLSEKEISDLLPYYWRPQPRLALGVALRNVATAAIDISDGLLADAGHLGEASGVRLHIDAQHLPLHPSLDCLHSAEAVRRALTGGDDYELLFSIPPDRQALLYELTEQCGVACTWIGEAFAGEPGAECPEVPEVDAATGWKHF